MATLLRGGPAAAALDAETARRAEALRQRGVAPTLAILRVGERPDDLSYEKGAMKRCGELGVGVKNVVLPAQVPSDIFFEELERLNKDAAVHGILMFRPLPGHIDGEAARKALDPAKDMDGCTDGSLAGVFTDTPLGYAPCTAQSALEILDYYGVELSGKRACVIGRSLVAGRPAAMLLMHRNATVTVCHTRTVDMPAIVREADVVVVCAGRMETIGKEYLRPGQTVIDVGIGWNEAKGKLCGDVKFDEAEPIVSAITPVPGGVGSVTASVLVGHVVEAAESLTGAKGGGRHEN